MAQHGFQMSGHGGNGIDPNDLSMSSNYQSSFQQNYASHSNPSNAYSSGSALFGDDELLDGLSSPTEPQSRLQGHGQDFGGMNDMSMGYNTPGIYSTQHHGLPMEQPHVNGFSSTPDGDPIQSPFVHNFGQYRQIQHPQSFAGTLQSPLSYAGSPLAGSDMNDGGETGFLSAKARARIPQAAQRPKPASARSPLTPKTAAMTGLSMNSEQGFGAQPIRTGGAHHEKTHSGTWINTPNSLSSFPGSGFSSPLQANLHSAQINDIMLKGGTSMPTKLGAAPSTAVSSQEAKRKRRRESHNLVERRRRDNINERIQDLSKLVPAHRLEDEKIRKALQNGSSIPELEGLSSSVPATSALAGPGARRATAGTAGNITTGLPIEEKDKGPNKGDILNGAVSWTRDLMWMLHLKLQQQEELLNSLVERGIPLPFEFTEDERRMQTELMEALSKGEDGNPKMFQYSRTDGSGLRVPHHTNFKGEPLNGNGGHASEHISISPDADGVSGMGHDLLDSGDFIDYDDDNDADLGFKEEDEYGMDLTQ